MYFSERTDNYLGMMMDARATTMKGKSNFDGVQSKYWAIEKRKSDLWQKGPIIFGPNVPSMADMKRVDQAVESTSIWLMHLISRVQRGTFE